MRNVNNSINTVNAAASAVVSAESRVQPSSAQKKRWRSCWFLYTCFGSRKNNKRIGHAPDEPVTSRPISVSQVQDSTILYLPFITPPSSPTSSFLDPSSAVSHTPPSGLLLLTVNTYSRNEHPSAFVIGPYAHETDHLVTPPVFSAFTTEPSTAPFTPPHEPAHVTTTTTTPSSPEVPFAQLLTSSLELARRNSCGVSHKFQSHQVYPASPGSYIESNVSWF